MESLDDIRNGRFEGSDADFVISEHLAKKLIEANHSRDLKSDIMYLGEYGLGGRYVSLVKSIGLFGMFRKKVVDINNGIIFISDSSLRQDVERIVPELNEASGMDYKIIYGLGKIN
ncbi:hypothetical protein HYT23_04160 [Candidatus Pacearchaeota archaeon]|nr:hypothetical protein [Candidatus Pacearchaeota archaeon]